MSKISLKHSGGNVVSLNSPTSAPTSADVAFKLPNADGSANQVLKTDGSGNLSFAADSGGKFESYAIISDTKQSNQNGGTATADAWRTRDLNTEIADPDGIVSISSNQFTLQAGSYLIKFQAGAHMVHRHMTALYDVTNTAYKQYGMIAYANIDNVQNFSQGVARVTISGATVYEIRHTVQDTRNSDGFGNSAQFNSSGDYDYGTTDTESIYTIVEIYKES